MANVSFVRTRQLSDAAKIYLESASNAVGGYFTLDMALAEANAGIGAFYCIFVDEKLHGCFFLRYRLIHIGKIMEVVLLGGIGIELWAKELDRILKEIAKDQRANEITLVGRKGWGRLFHDLEQVSCFYRFKVPNLT